MLEQIKSILDVDLLIRAFGYPGLFAIVFAETGLFFGFFLPGDSLMVTAGLLASQGILDIAILCPLLFTAAVAGDSVGYAIGHKVGRRLFNREDSIFFHKKHLSTAKAFYDKHGGKTIIIARFLPIVRTFAPVVAGMADMKYRTFVLFNLIGAFIWAVGLTLTGYFLGQFIPGEYFEPLIFAVIFLSLFPAFYHGLKTKEQRMCAISALASFVRGKKQ